MERRDHDWQLGPAWRGVRPASCEEAALEPAPTVAQAGPDDREVLAHGIDRMFQPHAPHALDRDFVTHADAEDEPAARNLIQRRGHLHHGRRMSRTAREDARADLPALGRG